MTSGLLNADGFGVGCYHPQRLVEPFVYKSTQPIWSDAINLPSISRFLESGCVLANVRSATPGLTVDLTNCQPFQHRQLLAMHNGFVKDFRHTLYRPIRDRLSDAAYQAIQGSTDSEHLLALLLHELELQPELSLTDALHRTVKTIADLARAANTTVSVNMILSDGNQLVASRCAIDTTIPTLYWLRDDPMFSNAVLIASEPIFEGNWQSCPEQSILTVTRDLDVKFLNVELNSI
jgi:glutamine amidotransferase